MANPITALSKNDLVEALANSGYSNDEFHAPKFKGFTQSQMAIYEIAFWYEGTIDRGLIYIEAKDDGKLYAEY